jgi:hypothetical protein
VGAGRIRITLNVGIEFNTLMAELFSWMCPDWPLFDFRTKSVGGCLPKRAALSLLLQSDFRPLD